MTVFHCSKCEASYRLTNEDHERDQRVGPEAALPPLEVRHRCTDGKWRSMRAREVVVS